MKNYKRDDYFDHNFQPGLITQMILAQKERREEKEPNTVALKRIFLSENCPAIAAIIEFLSEGKGRGLETFGSGSIIPEGQTKDTPFSIEAAMALRELYIGSKKYAITPLEWLGYFSQIIKDVPEDVRAIIDSLCRVVVQSQSGARRINSDIDF